MATAAEKRAARRARVLESSERRMQLLTGQLRALDGDDVSERSAEQLLDDGVHELLEDAGAASASAPEPLKMEIPRRVDPAQRRRDAARRRMKKESMVQELLATTETVAPVPQKSHAEVAGAALETTRSVGAVGTMARMLQANEEQGRRAEAAFSRHALALRVLQGERKLMSVAIVAVGVYCAMSTDLGHLVAARVLTSNPIFASYEQMLAQGVSLDAIRMQMQREQLDPSLQQEMELLFVARQKAAIAESMPRSSTRFWDLPGVVSHWIVHPPLLLLVLLLRIALSAGSALLQRLLQLPSIGTPSDDNLGWVLNFLLARRPAVKKYVIYLSQAVDDLFLLLWSLLLLVAIRVLLLQRESVV